MPTIEGIGDEVVHFFLGLGIVFICLLLWLTTRVRNADEPFFRTVYVLERRYRRTNVSNDRNRPQNTVERSAEGMKNLVTCDFYFHNIFHKHEYVLLGDRSNILPLEASDSQPAVTVTINRDAVPNNGDDISVVQNNNTESTTGLCGEEGILRRRLAFFKAGSHSAPTGNTTVKNSSPEEENREDQSEANNIKVRIKYLNDDLRVVDGILHERLSDFKK